MQAAYRLSSVTMTITAPFFSEKAGNNLPLRATKRDAVLSRWFKDPFDLLL